MHANDKGFTLIELMTVVGIIAILFAIAIPNYQSYLRRTACEEAKGALTGAANLMERFRAQNNTYVGAPDPDDAERAAITITASDASSFLLTATGNGSINGLILTLASTGARTDNNAALNIWDSCSGI